MNTILLNDITLTMKVGRSILLQYYGLTEKLHSHVFSELENIVFILLEFFLAPMQAIMPQDVHHNTSYDTHKAGTHFKYPDDLSAMKTLQDSYREFFDYDPLDFSRVEGGLEEIRRWTTGPKLSRHNAAGRTG